MDFVGRAIPLADADIVREAQTLGVEPAAIWAVCEVESAGGGFLKDKRPKILYEAHYFHTLTNGMYDRLYPNISSPYWDRSLYGPAGAHQYDRLTVALGLNESAGLESCSWGRFQIMGANFHACGYPNVHGYVEAMVDNEYNHLVAFGNFCRSSGIVGYLAQHDWAHFALRYNGAGNVSLYAQRLADAYQKYPGIRTPLPPPHPPAPPPAPPVMPLEGRMLKLGDQGNDVELLQLALILAGYPLPASGNFDAVTLQAVKDFQSKNALAVDGLVGPHTKGKLGL